MDKHLLSPCNYYCGNCAIYRKGKCLGCAKQSEKANAELRVFCDIYNCATDKRLTTCSDCDSYPCERYDVSIFAPSFIKWLRDKLEEAK